MLTLDSEGAGPTRYPSAQGVRHAAEAATVRGHRGAHRRDLPGCLVSPRRALPAGIRGRGSVFTYTWRDGAGRQFSRKAGDTLAEVEAFKRRIDDQLALGTYTPSSTMTFAVYATWWIETCLLYTSPSPRDS